MIRLFLIVALIAACAHAREPEATQPEPAEVQIEKTTAEERERGFVHALKETMPECSVVAIWESTTKWVRAVAFDCGGQSVMLIYGAPMGGATWVRSEFFVQIASAGI